MNGMNVEKAWWRGRDRSGAAGSDRTDLDKLQGGIKHAKLRLFGILIMGSVALVVLFVLSLTLGAVPMNFMDAINTIIALIMKLGNPEGLIENIIYHIRVPRGLAAIAVGVGLAVAGVVMQALIRNPLVDPYITGVSSGAGLGAALAGLAGITLISTIAYSIPLAAFVGAIVAFFVTMTLAEAAGGKAISYVLSGVIIGILVGAMTTLIITFNSDKLQGVLFWMFGSFAFIGWDSALMIAIPVLLTTLVILLYARDLNVILLGDEQAKQLGLNVKNLKRFMVVVVSILASVCVAFTGVIGFIGLVVPHVARILVGGDHRMLLPTSIVLGGILMLAADIAARTLFAPEELPVGAIVAMVGAPFFIFLMIRTGKKYGM